MNDEVKYLNEMYSDIVKTSRKHLNDLWNFYQTDQIFILFSYSKNVKIKTGYAYVFSNKLIN